MHDRRKRKRVFHINMLREFHSSPSSTACWTEEQDRGADEQDDIPVWNGVEEDADAEQQARKNWAGRALYRDGDGTPHQVTTVSDSTGLSGHR
ncbi:hypothetical protein EMCRGX_G012167 [Ephydatia muelleri]